MVIYLVWLTYTVAAIRAGRKQFRRVFGKAAEAADRIIVFTTLGSLLLVLIYYFSNYTSYITGALAFSVLLYCSWAATVLFGAAAATGTATKEQGKERNSLLSPDQENEFRRSLESVMIDDRLYINSSLKLADLADAVGCTPHQLSDLLNNTIGQSFHHFLNDRRITMAQSLIRSEEHLTLEAIGLSCGFNARSTFYKAFKKSTGLTPAQYREGVNVTD